MVTKWYIEFLPGIRLVPSSTQSWIQHRTSSVCVYVCWWLCACVSVLLCVCVRVCVHIELLDWPVSPKPRTLPHTLIVLSKSTPWYLLCNVKCARSQCTHYRQSADAKRIHTKRYAHGVTYFCVLTCMCVVFSVDCMCISNRWMHVLYESDLCIVQICVLYGSV